MRNVALVLIMLLTCASGVAAPVPEADRVPLDLRRTTLVVNDIEDSLAFYRDALGMQVIYDNAIRTPREANSDEEAERASRLVFLRANDDFIGVLGLLEYRKPRKTQSVRLQAFQPGTMVLLFNSENLDRQFEAARKVLGVRVLSEPTQTRYPNYSGDGFIVVRVSVLQDPDGFTVELNELISGE